MPEGEADPGPEFDREREQRVEALFGEYLKAVDRGEDRDEELLARAGELAGELQARMQLERELRALAPDKKTASGPGAPPQRIGRFQILGLLGKGGISVVYLAHDPDMGRRVALKVLNSESLLDKQNRAWMLNEARALAQLEHPSVVKVHEVGDTGTHTYLAMELVTGPSLRAVIDELARRARGEPPTVKAEVAAMAERLRSFSARTAVLRQLADALATCHDQGVLHRDIKPHNVLFDAQGTPKLIDFGLAHDARADDDSRIGLTQNLVGTAAYLAPEQVSGNETGADPRSDQFSFGIVAYELCALTNPFQKASQRLTMAAIEAADPPSVRSLAPALPNDLALVIHHALEREPKARYPDLRAVERDLAALLEHRPVTVEEPSLAHVARLWFRRHRQRVRLVSLVLLGVSGILSGLSLVSTLRQRRDLGEALESIRPEGFGTLDEFQRAFTLVESLSPEAASLDSSFWGQWLSPSADLSVRQIVHQLSENLDRVYDDDVARNLARGTPLQDQVYRELFWQEERLCPECVYNIENRLRGRVVLPEADGYERALDILCFERVHGATDAESFFTSIFRPAPLVELLTAGTYRFQMWSSGNDALAMEVVFYVPPGWNPEMTIPLSLRPGPFDPATIDVPGGDHRFANGLEMKLPGFEIMEGLVTIHDLRKFHADTGLAREYELQGLETAPAIVVYETAMSFASWAGGRVPLLEELKLAKQHGMALPPANAAGIGAELLLTLGPDGNPTYLAYRDGSVNMAHRKIEMQDRDGVVGFRIVIAKGTPQEYRVQAQQALLGAKTAGISEEAR